jgi:hypothetical protein
MSRVLTDWTLLKLLGEPFQPNGNEAGTSRSRFRSAEFARLAEILEDLMDCF